MGTAAMTIYAAVAHPCQHTVYFRILILETQKENYRISAQQQSIKPNRAIAIATEPNRYIAALPLFSSMWMTWAMSDAAMTIHVVMAHSHHITFRPGPHVTL